MTILVLGSLKRKPKTEQPILGGPIWVRMTITNECDRALKIIDTNVGVPPPDMNWKASYEAYQIGILMSFGLIQITLKDVNGVLVESNGLMPWVTPILGERFLQPNDNLDLNFDLNELFTIDKTGLYNLQIRYWDDELYASANTDIEIMPNR